MNRSADQVLIGTDQGWVNLFIEVDSGIANSNRISNREILFIEQVEGTNNFLVADDDGKIYKIQTTGNIITETVGATDLSSNIQDLAFVRNTNEAVLILDNGSTLVWNTSAWNQELITTTPFEQVVSIAGDTNNVYGVTGNLLGLTESLQKRDLGSLNSVDS